MTPTPTAPALLTLDEFARKHGGDHVELIDGIVRPLPMAMPLHGRVCVKATIRIGEFVERHDLGAVCSNDSFVVISRHPPRVRGADLIYWSKAKLPGGRVPPGLIQTPPDLCVEVASPTNSWTEVFTKVGEYLGVGVTVVLVIDPDTRTASVYRRDAEQQVIPADESLTLPDILPGFAVPVNRFFE